MPLWFMVVSVGMIYNVLLVCMLVVRLQNAVWISMLSDPQIDSRSLKELRGITGIVAVWFLQHCLYELKQGVSLGMDG